MAETERKEGDVVAWQYRIYFEERAGWSEWREGKHDNHLANQFEERALVPRSDYLAAEAKIAEQAAEMEQIQRLVEHAYRDGLAYATNVTLSRPAEYDVAWLTSKVSAALAEIGSGK